MPKKSGRAVEFENLPEDDKPLYPIGVVSAMFGIHQQSLRQYEREGLLIPRRTKGRTRMYSNSDIARLRVILNLTQDMGVNLAGVEIVLRMRDEMDGMRRQIDDLLNRLKGEIKERLEVIKGAETQGIVQVKERGITRRTLTTPPPKKAK